MNELYKEQLDVLVKQNAQLSEQIKDLTATATEWAQQVEDQKAKIDALRKLKEENKCLLAGYVQIRTLNGNKDSDIHWLCEKALAAQPQKGQDNE